MTKQDEIVDPYLDFLMELASRVETLINERLAERQETRISVDWD